MNSKEYNLSVDLYSDNVYRFILKNIRDEDRAHDIVQDSFEKLWRNLDHVNSEKVKSYLFTTAYHTMIDAIRKESRQTVIEDYNVPEETHDEQYSDLAEVLNEAVKRLPDIQRTVILLRDYEGYSYKEIGEVTLLSEAQVKVYIYRARVFLKSYIGKMELVV
ncbi:MAG TPA: RNA polymerase sigma factor [Prolixibacteraceae bacterium]|jgi:RNA polymerase sigma-70 factor (ECF subfamily)|nr:RNA polymerase sigma factor [Prolixibacteraceae bacterium]